MTDLSYRERGERLNNRMRAHKEFATTDISDWLVAFLSERARLSILDVGCGTGNHLGLYLDAVGVDGTVSGLDRESKLIEEARKRYSNLNNLALQAGSMDDRLPWSDDTFDTCLSNFAIYNAENTEYVISELRRVLQPGGQLVLIGPTINNSAELYEYNKILTGERIDGRRK